MQRSTRRPSHAALGWLLLAGCATTTTPPGDTDAAPADSDAPDSASSDTDPPADTDSDTDDPCADPPTREWTSWDDVPSDAPAPPSDLVQLRATATWTRTGDTVEIGYEMQVDRERPVTALGDPEHIDRCGPVWWNYPLDMTGTTSDDSFAFAATGRAQVPQDDGPRRFVFRATVFGQAAADVFGEAAPRMPAPVDRVDIRITAEFPLDPATQVVITGTPAGGAGPSEFTVLSTR